MFDIAIIGTGPVGLITAIALSQSSTHSICLFGPKPDQNQIAKDTRTTAFMAPSVTLLQNCKIWEKCKANASPLKNLRMIDDCGTIVRAPDCYFTAQELNMNAFAQNIPNSDLNSALISIIDTSSKIKWIETNAVTKVDHNALSNLVQIETASNEAYTASLCIGADGRNSICRKSAGLEAKSWQYNQTAIACTFTHSSPHNATSTEIHRSTGPMTLIPLEEYRSSLVWSLTPDEAKQVVSLNDEEFSQKLFEYSHSILGQITNVEPRVAFPISGLQLDKFAANRIALVGEAAHVIPPIGAQGMNLGLRDAAHLVNIFKNVSDLNQDLTHYLDEYTNSRKSDIWSRTFVIDVLNKSLLMNYLPLKTLRSTGLNLLRSFKSLRQYIMQQGLGEDKSLPPLMREEH